MATWRHNMFMQTMHRKGNNPVSQSCAVAKKWKILAGHWTIKLGIQTTDASKASKVWFSYSHNCALSSGAVFHSVCQVCLSSGPPECFTFTYSANQDNTRTENGASRSVKPSVGEAHEEAIGRKRRENEESMGRLSVRRLVFWIFPIFSQKGAQALYLYCYLASAKLSKTVTRSVILT